MFHFMCGSIVVEMENILLTVIFLLFFCNPGSLQQNGMLQYVLMFFQVSVGKQVGFFVDKILRLT